MDRDSFLAIVAIIKDHDVFQNRSAYPHAPALVQLVVALDRFGHEGNRACLNRTMLQWDVSHGSMLLFGHVKLLISELAYMILDLCVLAWKRGMIFPGWMFPL
ncbi:hypothetical protein R1sor_018765 [Riccia sorocarpa]|uniref:Uncharacterized protein n=1 Tax=Riccia sorocarpa TaxID=122646 RepID=A0ABD3IAP8_9MARC